MIRSILHRLSHGVVLKRRLPREFGGRQMFVSPESALAYWRPDLGKVDPFLLSMVRELVRPGMEVWDIGANVGLFSFAAAAFAAHVVAVEADPWLVELLHRSVQCNGAGVSVISAAVSDYTGSAVLHISPEGRSSNSLHGIGREQKVPSITLDSLLQQFPAPDVLKIDVEGMELAVLSGGRSVLEHRPALFCEVTDHYAEVGKLLSEFGYNLYAARAKDRTPLHRPSRDTLAIPA